MRRKPGAGEFNVLAYNAGGTGATIALADGKFFFTTGISWGAQPYSRFHRLWAMDANTGEFLWNITGSIDISAIAEGYLVGVDVLNGIQYCFGKGKTATTVSAPDVAVPKGTEVLIKGTVTDMSPAQANTPAVADESMSEWMDYLHMQNATLINSPPTPKGVTVLLYAIDPNGNYEEIGTVTSDSTGLFKMLWKPAIEGEYTVYATFMGSESYWTSTGTTALGVTEAAATNGGTEQPPTAADNTGVIVGTGIAVIIAVAVGVLLLL